jgi:hypothetical protein
MSSTKSLAKFFTKRLGVKITIPIIIVMLFAPAISFFDASGQVQTQDCFAPLTTILDASYAGPVVVDSYWVDQGTSSASDVTSNPVKKEVGPGEGPSVFAVVFNNRNSALPITSVTAFLNLPSGFVSTGESKNPQLLQKYNQASKVVGNEPAIGNYYGQIPAGASFTMYFNINILPTAKVGTFATTVVANYVQVGVVGQQCTSALLNVPFVLPGKVILDASSVTSDLAPQIKNPISIEIDNKGSADATGVVATIVNLGNSKGSTGSSSGGSVVLQSSTTQIVNLGPNTFNLGTIPVKSKAVISTTVYPSTAASGSTQEVQLQITYQNAWGKLSTANISTGLVIAPNPPESLNLSYLGNTTTPVITASMLDDLDFAVQNNSTNPMSNIVISLVPQSTSVSIVGSSTWTIPNLEPGDRQVLATKVYAANTLINTPTSFTLTANYVSKGQSQTNSLTLGTFVVGDIKLRIYDLSITSLGGSSTIAGNLLNQGSTTGLYTTVQLAPSQFVDTMRAARFANSTNEQSYSQSAQTDSGSQGQGFQGGQNSGDSGFGGQGSGGQRFQGRGGQGLQGQGGQGFQGQGGQRSVTQQFIGDLSPDSPIPFSIPLRGINSLQPGMYQVAFKITYADDLKNFHNVILNGTVGISGRNSQIASTHDQQTSIFDDIPLPMIAAAAIGAAVVAFLLKRRKSKNKKLQLLTKGDTDIVSIFDGTRKKENES